MHRRGISRNLMADPAPKCESPATPVAGQDKQFSSDSNDGIPIEVIDLTESPTDNPQPGGSGTQSEDRGHDASLMPPPDAVVPHVNIRRKRGSVPNVQNAPSQEDENSLYYILRNGTKSLDEIVNNWISTYRLSKETALIQLMQFFVDSSGSKEAITQEMARGPYDALITNMVAKFDKESGDYPLAKNGKAWRIFHKNFCNFIYILLISCHQESIIYDAYFMISITSFLTNLSDADIRAFRHTATLTSMRLMTALVDISLSISERFNNVERQVQDERSNELEIEEYRLDEELLSVFAIIKEELEDKMTKIVIVILHVLNSVVAYRYRDTLPEIRAIIIVELSIWMERLPRIFLDDRYLKYIAWTLHDKVAEVRLKCLQALQLLYSQEGSMEKLQLFSSKFMERIVFMTLDKNYNVAVQAVNLLTIILKNHTNVLKESECKSVCKLIFSSNRAVGQAAGEFLKVHIFSVNENVPLQTKSGGERRLPNTTHVKSLVHFFRETKHHDFGACLVDSLIDSHPMMKDWECMTDLLLKTPGNEEDDFDDLHKSALIELMKCCVQQAATGEPPEGRRIQRNKACSTQKEQAKVSKDRQNLTAHFIVTLPLLLAKYSTDAINLPNLLAISQYFKLDVYKTTAQESALTSLLEIIRDIINGHSKYAVLEKCSKSLEILCTEGTAIATKCAQMRRKIIDMLAKQCKLAVAHWKIIIKEGNVPGKVETFQLIYTLKKVCTLNMYHNLNRVNMWELIFCYLPENSEPTNFPTKALIYCIKCCFFYITYGLVNVEKKQNKSDAIEMLQGNLHAFIAQCKTIVASGYDADVKEVAYLSICDLAIYFAEPLYSVHHQNKPKMKLLVYVPDAETCDILNAFVQKFVFVQPETDDPEDNARILQLDKGKNYLAAYCKLIVYKAIPIWRGSDIFKHYVKFCDDFGDMIKLTLKEARDISRLECAVTILLSLQNLFTEMLPLTGGKSTNEIKTLREFIHLKELAKKLSVLFGSDTIENRQSITSLHCTGISFAMREGGEPKGGGSAAQREDSSSPPPNILFFEIINEFTYKLLRQDKRAVLEYLLQKVTTDISSSARSDDWRPLLLYRNYLIHDAGELTVRK